MICPSHLRIHFLAGVLQCAQPLAAMLILTSAFQHTIENTQCTCLDVKFLYSTCSSHARTPGMHQTQQTANIMGQAGQNLLSEAPPTSRAVVPGTQTRAHTGMPLTGSAAKLRLAKLSFENSSPLHAVLPQGASRGSSKCEDRPS